MGIARRPRSGLKLPPRARELSLLVSLHAVLGDFVALQPHYVDLVSWAYLTNRDDDHVWN